MKKIFTFAVAAMVGCFALTSCGGDNKAAEENAEAAEAPAVEDVEATVEETVAPEEATEEGAAVEETAEEVAPEAAPAEEGK